MCLKVAALDDVVARPSKSLVVTVASKEVVSRDGPLDVPGPGHGFSADRPSALQTFGKG